MLLFFSWCFSLRAESDFIESLKFKDADINIVLQAISQKAYRQGQKVNIVATPEVQGLVSVSLENIDWESALKSVLKAYGYAYTKQKNVIMVATPAKIQELESQESGGLDSQLPRMEIFNLKYIDANDAKRTIEPLLSATGKASVLEVTGQAGWQLGGNPAKKAALEEGPRLSRTKILVVLDNRAKIKQITDLIDEIDIMPKQILIKARIMEVNVDYLKDIGFDWGTGSGGATSPTIYPTPTSKKGGKILTQLGGNVLGSQKSPAIFNAKTAGMAGFYPYNTGLSLLFQKMSGNQFEVLLHALEENVKTNTLSSPVIMTMNNQEASILVGTQFPIIKTEVSTQTNEVIGGSLQEYKDIGIQLNVVPQICGDKDDYINLIIHPAVSTYTTTTKVISQSNTTLVEYPIIDTREAQTQIVIKDGETIVMGGLLKDVISYQRTGIPFLKKLPWVGVLFRRDTTDKSKVDLMIFITAKIVKPGEILSDGVVNTRAFKEEFDK